MRFLVLNTADLLVALAAIVGRKVVIGLGAWVAFYVIFVPGGSIHPQILAPMLDPFLVRFQYSISHKRELELVGTQKD